MALKPPTYNITGGYCLKFILDFFVKICYYRPANTIKDVRLNQLTITEFTIIASDDNLTTNWPSYFISRPKSPPSDFHQLQRLSREGYIILFE